MKKKIIKIIVCMLLIAATVLPVSGNETLVLLSNDGDIMDQSQQNCSNCSWTNYSAWQEFVPTVNNLVRVEVSVATSGGSDAPPLNLTIEKPLGTILTKKSLPWSALPHGYCDWVSFDVPDISISPGVKYYIVLSFDYGADYLWCGALNNPYPPGESNINPDWDWTFRTFYEAGAEECCITINNVTGGLFNKPLSFKVNAVIINTGTTECRNVSWGFNFSGGFILFGPNSGIIPSILPGGTAPISSKIVIGFAGLLLFPGNVTITADAANNACPPASVTKDIIVIGFLLKVKP